MSSARKPELRYIQLYGPAPDKLGARREAGETLRVGPDDNDEISTTYARTLIARAAAVEVESETRNSDA